MVGHGGSSAGSYLADPTSPIPSQCASIVVASTLTVNTIFKSLHFVYILKADILIEVRQYISCHGEACSNHLAISDFLQV